MNRNDAVVLMVDCSRLVALQTHNTEVPATACPNNNLYTSADLETTTIQAVETRLYTVHCTRSTGDERYPVGTMVLVVLELVVQALDQEAQ